MLECEIILISCTCVSKMKKETEPQMLPWSHEKHDV